MSIGRNIGVSLLLVATRPTRRLDCAAMRLARLSSTCGVSAGRHQARTLLALNAPASGSGSGVTRQDVRQIHQTTRLLKQRDNDDDDDNGGNSAANEDGHAKEATNETNSSNSMPLIPSMAPLAPITAIPEFLPKVPLVAVSRNPLFPRFIRMLEVSQPTSF